MYQNIFKRIFDLLGAVTLLIILGPIMIICAIIIKVDANDLPILFMQNRVGKNLKIFTIYKFRTMNENRNLSGALLTDSDRLTPTGRFLRKTSLDELPQIFNILRGEMSFIGPRPLLVEYISLYTKEQNRRHNVTPGISGWAQINGRNSISWDERFQYDIYYVEHVSFLLDCRIVLLTIENVFKRSGISSKTSETMEKFSGSTSEAISIDQEFTNSRS